ncbi:hypothetical protein Baya_10832 [Bagarius yarrelli]|uniref:Uncharacterized protein n=1 Tax=Bagarius yarrelli TaxID=175774 RepID=A0A556UY54_BAGYA|nr:hypothetical protein Baya_10832 [Bagarius yarrelli]
MLLDDLFKAARQKADLGTGVGKQTYGWSYLSLLGLRVRDLDLDLEREADLDRERDQERLKKHKPQSICASSFGFEIVNGCDDFLTWIEIETGICNEGRTLPFLVYTLRNTVNFDIRGIRGKEWVLNGFAPASSSSFAETVAVVGIVSPVTTLVASIVRIKRTSTCSAVSALPRHASGQLHTNPRSAQQP